MVAAVLPGAHIWEMDVGATISVSVNGGALVVADGMSVAGLLGQLALDPRKVAVERNEEIVVRSRYDSTVLQAGDRLEVVHFIGGG